MELYDIVKVFKHYFWLFILLTLLSSASAWYVSTFMMAPLYKSTAMVIISKNEPDSEYSSNSQGPLLDSNSISLFTKVAQSDTVASEIISSLYLKMNIGKLQKTIKINPDLNTGILNISVETDKAVLSYNILKAYLNILQSESDNLFLGVYIHVVDAPKLPATPSSPIIPLNISLSALGGMLASLLLSIILSNRRREKSGPYLLKKTPQLSVMGSLPEARGCVNELYYPSGNNTEESANAIGANLKLLLERESIKKTIISSFNRSDGKTTLAINLAAAMVKQNKKVLVVDCNTTSPSYFKIGMMEGDYFNGSHFYFVKEYLVKHIHRAGFDIIMAPQNESNIDVSRMLEIIESLENCYDLILFDCPPLTNADTIILTNDIKNIILVADYRHLTSSILEKFTQQLIRANANILGIVINRLPPGRQISMNLKAFDK